MPEYKVGSIDPRRTVLIVVDMQDDFIAVGEGVPVADTAHVHRERGFDPGLFKPDRAMAAGEAFRDGSVGAGICPEVAPEPLRAVDQEASLQRLFRNRPGSRSTLQTKCSGRR